MRPLARVLEGCRSGWRPWVGERPWRRERWIVLASLRLDVFWTEASAGYWLACVAVWQGRWDWCQPARCRDWRNVWAAARCRLGIAGLEAVCFATAWPEKRGCQGKRLVWLLALVRRTGRGTRLRERRRKLKVGSSELGVGNGGENSAPTPAPSPGDRGTAEDGVGNPANVGSDEEGWWGHMMGE